MPFLNKFRIPSFGMKSKKPQLQLLQRENSAYGGELLKKDKNRKRGRPIVTNHTMHLVLRSTKAVGEWSFKRPQNEKKIKEIIEKFSQKYGVRILSLANVGNHLHMQIKLGNRRAYYAFIRAITAAIAMAVTQISRWNKLANKSVEDKKWHFWDYRPFTRVVESFKAFLNLRDYIRINALEGAGTPRAAARFLIKHDKVLNFSLG